MFYVVLVSKTIYLTLSVVFKKSAFYKTLRSIILKPFIGTALNFQEMLMTI